MSLKGLRFFSAARPNLWLIAIIVAGHLHAIFFYGATFWVDSEAYVHLAQFFLSPHNAQALMADPKLWLYTSHIPLGEPFIWFLVSSLPEALIWPALALIQHGCGALAQIYLFTTLNKLGGGRLLIFPCLAMSFLPFYQAMHNCLMTEALSGACFLTALAACLRLAFYPRKRDYAFLLISGLGAFFRTYFVLVPLVSLFVLFLWRKIPLTKTALLGGACTFGLLLTPAWVYLTTSQLWIPSLGVNAMWQTANFAPRTSPAVTAYVNTLSWPNEKTKQHLLNGKFSRFDTIAASVHWQEAGMTRQEANAASLHIAALFNAQHKMWKTKTGAALICMGVPNTWLPTAWRPGRVKNPEQLQQRQEDAYRFFSWVAPDEKRYAHQSSLPYYHNSPEHELLKQAWRPYLNFSSPERSRDIFYLSAVPPVAWAVLGAISILVLALSGKGLCAALAGLNFLALLAVFYTAGIPGVRYVYLPLLLYLSSIAMMAALLPQRRVNENSRPANEMLRST